jgi:circadian clock protein KaiC
MIESKATTVAKRPTFIDGFDFVAHGGVVEGRSALVVGTAGSAKTVFAIQFLAGGIRSSEEPAVFVTFEETPDDIRKNAATLGFDIAGWERGGKWAFVDASPSFDEAAVIGAYDLNALLVRIEHAVGKISAKRLVLDSLTVLLNQFQNDTIIRREVFRIIRALRQLGVTAVITAERSDDKGPITSYNIEEFVSDTVIILRNSLEQEKRRRTVEILKSRGAAHQKGEYPFTVLPGSGIVVIPLSAIQLKQASSVHRIASGNTELDSMCGGGFFRDSIILLSGATGTGKTLITTEFVSGGVSAGERCLFFAFEESRQQLTRNAASWSKDFERMESDQMLHLVCEYPETASLEDHLLRMKQAVEAFKPTRIAVDSLSALERVGSERSFREFVIALTSFIKEREIAALFTATTPTLLGGSSVTESHISTITDSIILLRYVEMHGEMRRGITVLKMRGSAHDKEIREFTIDGKGLHIGKPFRDVVGILSGHPRQTSAAEMDRLSSLFEEAHPDGGLS